MTKLDSYLAAYIIAMAIIGVAYIERSGFGNDAFLYLILGLICIPFVVKFVLLPLLNFAIYVRFLPSEMGIPQQQVQAYLKYLRSGSVSLFDKYDIVRNGYEAYYSSALSKEGMAQQADASDAASQRPGSVSLGNQEGV